MASSPVPYGFPQPSPGAFEMQAPVSGDGNTARLMQIKVLYTFDDEKTNCLARCSQPVFVHTLMLEDNTEIGIVELSTCIRAIVSASPELVAKLGQDYTIYAYDYSEYETPLVGQGMLSWALASTSTTPTAPADQSRTPVTGRVVKNARSLFPNAGPSEILQVKLKLVPVPKSMQSEYAEGVERYRDANNFASQGFDPAAWNAFLQARQSFSAPATSPGPPQSAPAMYVPSPQNPTTFYQPSPQSNLPQQPPQLVFQANNGAPVNPGPSQRVGSRPGTPRARRGSNQSRPSSRASNRGGGKAPKAATMPAPLQRTETAPAAVPTSEPNDSENAQARKRARVEQADWRGPSAFDSGNEPLRVAASAAASMRGHRPSLPGHPTAADIAAAEPGPRPPTPRPTGLRLQRFDSSGSVNQVPAQRPLRYQSPYTMSAAQSDGVASEAPSPMDDVMSSGSTPADIPSSPPVFHRTPAEASSPQLPRDANDHDSGFVSGNLDECLNDATDSAPQGDGCYMAAPKKVQQARPSLNSEMSFTEEVPGDPSLLPKNNNQTQRPQPAFRAPSGGVQRLGSVPASSPRLPPLIPSRTEATSPPHSMLDTDAAPQSEMLPIAPRPLLQQSESASQENDALAAIASVSHKLPPAVAGKLGSGAKRYRSIQTRLVEDLAAGKMPPFCKNCGEIDTPTWRKCFVKTVQGIPDVEKLSEEENLISWEVTEKEEDGGALAYRLIKKSVTREEEGYEQQQLCNSCGIWLFKTKSMRPPDKWAKASKVDKNGKPGRKRPARGKTPSASTQSKTDAMGMNAEDAALWSALTIEHTDSNECALTDVSGRTDKSVPKSTGKRPRSSTAEVMSRSDNIPFLADKSAMEALQRAIQSSPPKFPGSKVSPIDLSKESPQEVRRLLFPSPRKEGEAKTLDGSPSTGTPTKSTGARVVHMQDPFADNSDEQENGSGQFTTPKGKKSRVDLLKTPTRSSPRLKEKHEARQSAESRKQNNPETPSRAASQHITAAEMTPFTAQLNQMMSDGIGGFGDFGDMGQDPSGMFTMSSFGNIDDFGLDNMQMPHSDGDFFPVLDDAELMADVEAWNGGPLLEGELDELLKEAGDDAYLDNGELATNGGPTPVEMGQTG